MKKVLKFKYQDHEGYLSVVEKEGFYYSLVQKETHKVKDIRHTHKLLISSELKIPVYEFKHVNVIDDVEVAAWVFEALKQDNNLYFKQLDESLCVLEISL